MYQINLVNLGVAIVTFLVFLLLSSASSANGAKSQFGNCVNTLSITRIAGGTTRIPLRPGPVAGDLVVVDTNMIDAVILTGIISDFAVSQVRRYGNEVDLPDSMSFEGIDEYRLFRDRDYRDQLVKQGRVSQDTMLAMRFINSVHEGPGTGYFNFLSSYLENRGRPRILATPTIIGEMMHPEYILEGNELVWQGPRTTIKNRILPNHFINRQLVISSMQPQNLKAFEEFKSRSLRAEVGGHKGEKDRQILLELKYAQRNKAQRLGFATTDANFIKGLLRMHLNSNIQGDELMKLMRTEKVDYLLKIPNVADVIDFPYWAKVGDWQDDIKSSARMIYFRDLDLGDGDKIDLYAFFAQRSEQLKFDF